MIYKYYDLGKYPNIEIIPLSDLHADNGRFLKEQFIAARDFILAEPHRFTLFTGDLFEQALKQSKFANVYHAGMAPSDAIDWLEEAMRPLVDADRVLLMLSGNHDKRSVKEVDHDPVRVLSKYLGIVDRFDPWEGVLQIATGNDKRHNRQIQYTVYATHGNAGGQSISSPANKLERLSMKVDTDLYIAGHSHKAFAFPHKTYRVDYGRHRLNPQMCWFVGLSSFLDDGDYDVGAMLQPYGCIRFTITLRGDMKKITVAMNA